MAAKSYKDRYEALKEQNYGEFKQDFRDFAKDTREALRKLSFKTEGYHSELRSDIAKNTEETKRIANEMAVQNGRIKKLERKKLTSLISELPGKTIWLLAVAIVILAYILASNAGVDVPEEVIGG